MLILGKQASLLPTFPELLITVRSMRLVPKASLLSSYFFTCAGSLTKVKIDPQLSSLGCYSYS